MGLKEFYPLVKANYPAAIKEVTLKQLEGKTLAIDTYMVSDSNAGLVQVLDHHPVHQQERLVQVLV